MTFVFVALIASPSGTHQLSPTRTRARNEEDEERRSTERLRAAQHPPVRPSGLLRRAVLTCAIRRPICQGTPVKSGEGDVFRFPGPS